MFSLEKKDEPEDEAKGETKDEPVAEPDKVIITKQYNKEFLRRIVCVLECLKGSVTVYHCLKNFRSTDFLSWNKDG